jgi:hypothetical protein
MKGVVVLKLFPKILSLILILAITAGLMFIAFGSIKSDNYYIVDKAFALSYIDEYGFLHDDVFWLVVGDNEELLTVFTNPYTWYRYSVGEQFRGSMDRFIVYEGDESIARHLEGLMLSE